LALGFEAPMFVPIRKDPNRLTAVRKVTLGRAGSTGRSPASAGATVLVTGLVLKEA